MSVKINAVYQGGLRCEAKHGPSGQTITTDAPVDNNGRGEAFSPTDLVATGLGTCLATIMGMVADRIGVDLTGMTIHVEKEMTTVPIRRIGKLTAIVKYPSGKTISAADKKRLEEAAMVCPVKQSLHPDTELDIRFE